MVDRRTPRERLSRRMRHRREHLRKIYHTTERAAEEHAADLNARPDNQDFQRPYKCKWAEDWTLGETAMVHWHVGRDVVRGTNVRSNL